MRLVVLCCLTHVLMALELPSVIGDHMVLQRETAAPIWGWAEPGSAVVVRFAGQRQEAVAAADGRWEVALQTGAAGGPHELVVAGDGEERRLSDVLVGEVWVAGGQSNMWWAVDRCRDATAVVAAANQATIRFFDANTHPQEGGWEADEPARTVDAQWSVCTPQTVGSWAGTAYFFAQRLQETLDVPVGIVHVAVPGRAVECFMRSALVDGQFPHVAVAYAHEQEDRQARQADYEAKQAAWEAGGKQGAKPVRPRFMQRPCGLWNGTVAPCVPFAASGFIWWQGEANAGRPQPYLSLFAAMVQDWREQWRLADAPFYVAELANFGTRPETPVQDAPWPAVRDAQQRACDLLNHVYAVNTIDVMDLDEPGAPWQIHPRNKQLIGQRMAHRALVEAYGAEALLWRCPRVVGMTVEGASLRLTIDQSAGGLQTRDGEPPRSFAIAGPDRQWHAATARIEDDSIVLSSPAVATPVAARHAWANNPDVNTVNAAGAPLAQWRSDSWLLWPR